MFIHDLIKIMYVNIGYLPNYPYYLISDTEMIEAFCKDDGFFNDYYPCPDPTFDEPYQLLKQSIFGILSEYVAGKRAVIPDWVYSYMLMRPITFESDEADIAYMYELTGVKPETTLAEFSPALADACYATSVEWMKKMPSKYRDRPPTMFGETHVTKSLRLKQANILVEAEGV